MSGYSEYNAQSLPEPLRQAFFAINSFAMSLAGNVIKDARPHRVVYAKSIVFRSFLDVKPHPDHLEVKIIKGRKSPSEVYKIRNLEEVGEIKIKIKDAYHLVT